MADQTLLIVGLVLVVVGVALLAYVAFLMLAPVALANTCDEAQRMRKEGFWRGIVGLALAAVALAIGIPLLRSSYYQSKLLPLSPAAS